MLFKVLGKAFAKLMEKPIRLWGISLLYGLLSVVASCLCGFAIPGLGIAVGLLLSTSMTMVYLHGYRGEKVMAVHLFDCFKDWATIKRVLCGMAWMTLWIFLWALIPIVGIVFAIIRTYEYRFTPYILVHEPDVAITDAIKVSKERTKGYKGKMFWGDVLPGVFIGVAALLLALLAQIPYAGILFSIILVLVYIATFLFLPLYQGLVRAAFYEEITNPTEEPEPEPVPAEEDPTAAKLQSLKKLLDDGILTQEEFDAKKQQILGL